MNRDFLSQRMREAAELTDAYLQETFDKTKLVSPLLRESMLYSLFAGGKRLRPFLCLEAARICSSKTYKEAVPAAAALEMIHTYSLIHDDLPAMDNDDMRRGKPSNHKMFGEANAILAGDGLLSFAFLILSEKTSQQAAGVIANGALAMVAGQSLDLDSACSESELYRIHSLKTGALIRASVLAGALSVGEDDSGCRNLADFADHFGLLFQITDDILDVVGNTQTLGKTTGKDAAEDKLTFVSLYGIDGARKRAAEEADKAEAALSDLGSEAKALRELIGYTLTRDH